MEKNSCTGCSDLFILSSDKRCQILTKFRIILVQIHKKTSSDSQSRHLFSSFKYSQFNNVR